MKLGSIDNWAILIAVVSFTVLILMLVSAFATHSTVYSTVTSSNQYPAGTIDGNSTVIGYNITTTYRGLVLHTTVLCPLYPVGSKYPVIYNNIWWVWPSLSNSVTLPRGC